MSYRQAVILSIVGGILAAVGSLLPWVTASAGIFSRSISGTDGDGRITLVLGAAIAVMAFIQLERRSRPLRFATTLAAAAGLLVGGYDYSSLSAKVADQTTISASIGIGLYLVLAGSVLAAVGSLLATPISKTHEDTIPSPAVPEPKSGSEATWVMPQQNSSRLVAWWQRATSGQKIAIAAPVVVVLFVGVMALGIGRPGSRSGSTTGIPSTTLPPASLASQMFVSLVGCTQDGATGVVHNGSDRTVDIFIKVDFLDSAGTIVGNGIDSVSGVRPNENANWTASYLGGGSFDKCRAEDPSAYSNP